MITNLDLKNFIIVENLNVVFSEGLQILSGETGAGKSIIVGAIDLIFGGEQRPGMLLDESKPATLDLTLIYDESNSLLVDLVKKFDIDISEQELFFRREIAVNKKSKSFINGRRTSNRVLRQFRAVLLDFHSQREQQNLFDKNYQLEIIDRFGDLMDKREIINEKFVALGKTINDLEKLEKSEAENKDKVKLFQYQVAELENLDIQINEDVELEHELNILNHAEEILNLASTLNTSLYDSDDSVHDLINNLLFRFTNFENDNDKIKQIVIALKDSLAGVEDAVASSQSIQNSISVDKDRLDQTVNRLNEINRLKSKYKLDLAGLLQYLEDIKSKINKFSSQKDTIEVLKQQVAEDGLDLRKAAEQLSKERKKSAKKFEEEIKKNIRILAIPDAAVEIRFESISDKNIRSPLLEGLNENGMDLVNVYFSANKGIKVQPLNLTASGGELSRFLLSIKKIISEQLDKRTIVLDEIDSGIGGKTAELLGDFIHAIGENHQVLCITHLAQIASFADRHFAIRKFVSDKGPRIEIAVLSGESRKIEIARMVSGKQTEAALIHAEEILTKKEINL